MESSLPLSRTEVHKSSIVVNRTFAVIHSIAIALLIYYRLSFLFYQETGITIPWLLVFASELLLSFIWLIGQAYYWRPVSRVVFPNLIPKNEDALPAIDVFIFTADPDKEPTVEVMNTVLSAMALDYPADKLHVYLSDDAGSRVTLQGMREAWRFAKWWLPFCNKYRIKTGCPEAYFLSHRDDESRSSCFFKDNEIIKDKYDEFKERIAKAKEDRKLKDESGYSSRDHPAVIEVIDENVDEMEQEEKVRMPVLVYVSREKRPSHLHNFKAGAINVLLRVSGVMSNSPYILALDCDMYCNDPSSAKQAMCFHLDPNMCPSLAFVQFPQKFANISNNDIYDSQIRNAFQEYWLGMDGLRGPCLSGSNFYIKRKSLYFPSVHKGIDFEEVRRTFGPSNEFIQSLHQDYQPNTIAGRDSSSKFRQETELLASCTYENETTWGKKVGFLYNSVVEDYFTSFILHSRGWTSVYINPSRPQFLGTSTTNLNDLLIQGTRWSSGLAEVALSRFSPLIYGPFRMSFLQSMCYAQLAFFPLLYCFPLWCLATIPQLCLLNGIPLYPEVSSPFFKVYSFVFISSLSKHLYDVIMSGGTIQTWRNENRIWMMKSFTCHLYGTLDAVMKKLKLRQASFIPTNKITDHEQVARYQKGVFDFQASTMLLAPLATLATVNLVSSFAGITRAVVRGDLDRMFVQAFISVYILVMNYVILEGMILRKDKGRIPSSVSLLSCALALIFLIFGSIFFMF